MNIVDRILKAALTKYMDEMLNASHETRGAMASTLADIGWCNTSSPRFWMRHPIRAFRAWRQRRRFLRS